MKNALLAVDCSLRWTNVAVLREGVVVASEQRDIGRRQAAELPLTASLALEKADCATENIDLIAVTNGPGYFTGLRVGVAWAAALAYGLGVKIVPVSTLRMLAYPSLSVGQPTLAIVYAGHGFVYAGSFGCDGGDLPAGEYTGPALGSWLSARNGVTVVSDDPERACAAIEMNHAVVRTLPDAAIVARIADSDRNAAIPPMDLRISYHRAPQGYTSQES